MIDRINQCNSISEIEGWERTFSYHPILKDNFEWDYCFLLALIKFKLQKMSEYFNNRTNEDSYNSIRKSNYIRKRNICDKLLGILEAGYEDKVITDEDLYTKVNTRNLHRFFTPMQIKFIMDAKLKEYYLSTVRATKAKKLFWKYFEHHIEELWD